MNDSGNAVAIDGSGNVVTTGWFGATVDPDVLGEVTTHDCYATPSCLVPMDTFRPRFGYEEGSHGYGCAETLHDIAMTNLAQLPWPSRMEGSRQKDGGRVILVDPRNSASQRVAEKAGFTREGVLRAHTAFREGRRDSVIFSLLPADLD